MLRSLRDEDEGLANESRYLRICGGFPLCREEDSRYYSDSADAFRDQLEEIRSAKRFIFLEYHCIEDGSSFARMLELLKTKAEEGLDVRILYDDLGSMLFINRKFIRKITESGIRCRRFNPVLPFLNVFMGNRDHHKIMVVDGRVAFTGGYNLADEYFNMVNPYGHWKDNGIKLVGPAVQSLTAMFVEMWNFADLKTKDDNMLMFEPVEIDPVPGAKGYCVPYCDSPLDNEPIGENVYLNMINNAQDYCWFMTPYLVLSDELARALQIASKRGVDVRIMTPGIPDKKFTYHVTRSYYNMLVTSGVQIFEYTPGFNHTKTCICDDKCAVVGTINLDFRSLYHHFENAVYMFKTDCIADIKDDFVNSFEE